MVVGFVISAHHHKSCEFESLSWRAVLDTTLYEQVCQWFATGRRLCPSTLVSSSNKTNRHDITDILLKVALNTIPYPNPKKARNQLHRDSNILLKCYLKRAHLSCKDTFPLQKRRLYKRGDNCIMKIYLNTTSPINASIFNLNNYPGILFY
jgi:hypothetical protein